jgi:hypothetical protein
MASNGTSPYLRKQFIPLSNGLILIEECGAKQHTIDHRGGDLSAALPAAATGRDCWPAG